MWESPAVCGHCTPGLRAVDGIKKQAEEAVRNEPVGSTRSVVSASCLTSLDDR